MAVIRVKQGGEIISLSLDFLGLLAAACFGICRLGRSRCLRIRSRSGRSRWMRRLPAAADSCRIHRHRSATVCLVQIDASLQAWPCFPLLIALPLLSEGSDIDTAAATMAIAMPSGTAIDKLQLVEKAQLGSNRFAPLFWGINCNVQTVFLSALSDLEWLYRYSCNNCLWLSICSCNACLLPSADIIRCTCNNCLWLPICSCNNCLWL